VGIANLHGFHGFIETEVDASVRRVTAPAGPSQVWGVMPTVLEALDVEIETFDATVMAIGNTNFSPRRLDGRRMSRYLDCGTNFGRPNADRYRVSLYLMVLLEGVDAESTSVTTVLDAYARPMDVAGGAVHCTSEGRLERRIEELVLEHLQG
jgi:hypothetical protein